MDFEENVLKFISNTDPVEYNSSEFYLNLYASTKQTISMSSFLNKLLKIKLAKDTVLAFTSPRALELCFKHKASCNSITHLVKLYGKTSIAPEIIYFNIKIAKLAVSELNDEEVLAILQQKM